MKWITALIIGAVLGTVLPTAVNGGEGNWMDSWAGWGTIRPLANSPGLLLSIPMFDRGGDRVPPVLQLASHAERVETPDRIPMIRVTAMPADTNPYGGVFGGWLMGQMGLACGSFASRRTRGKAILVAADALKFPGAMAVGDELSVYVDLLKQGRTSLKLESRSDRPRARRRKRERSWPRASSPSSRSMRTESREAIAGRNESNG